MFFCPLLTSVFRMSTKKHDSKPNGRKVPEQSRPNGKTMLERNDARIERSDTRMERSNHSITQIERSEYAPSGRLGANHSPNRNIF